MAEKLSISSEALEDAREAFDNAMRNLYRRMVDTGAGEGKAQLTITMKTDGSERFGAQVMEPMITFKAKTTVTIAGEQKGIIGKRLQIGATVDRKTGEIETVIAGTQENIFDLLQEGA